MLDPNGRLHVNRSREVGRYGVGGAPAPLLAANDNTAHRCRVLDHILSIDAFSRIACKTLADWSRSKNQPSPPPNSVVAGLLLPLGPGEREAGTKPSMIVDPVLPLVAEAIAQSKVRTQAPAREENAGVRKHVRGRISNRHLVLRGLPGRVAVERGIGVLPLKPAG